MRTMASVGVLLLLSGAALAQDQGAEVKKMLTGKTSGITGGAAVPTGYQVPGETYALFDAFLQAHKRVNPQDTGHGDFWKMRDRYIGPAGPGSSGGN